MFLSRACLGKKMTFMYKWLPPPPRFLTCAGDHGNFPVRRLLKAQTEHKTRQDKTTGSKLNQMTNSIVQIQPSLSLPLWLPGGFTSPPPPPPRVAGRLIFDIAWIFGVGG
eukprot:COSAG06_NODE_1854_length_8211_cov_50.893738_10_plen_110_part_00